MNETEAAVIKNVSVTSYVPAPAHWFLVQDLSATRVVLYAHIAVTTDDDEWQGCVPLTAYVSDWTTGEIEDATDYMRSSANVRYCAPNDDPRQALWDKVGMCSKCHALVPLAQYLEPSVDGWVAELQDHECVALTT